MLISAPFDWKIARRSTVFRKGYAHFLKPVNILQRQFCSCSHYIAAPPVVVNSVPKSGTHLMLQIVRALPGSQYRGNFIATSTSLTQRKRSASVIASKIGALLPSEAVGSHIYHSDYTAAALREINALHIFVYRDPRAVILSEIFYLTEMNRFHRMHRHFRNARDFQDRLNLALDGYDEKYPEAPARLFPYAAWIETPDTLPIRYEDLIGANRTKCIAQVASRWRAQAGLEPELYPELEMVLANAIIPSKSHTFREGGSDKWRAKLTDRQIEQINNRLAKVVKRFGYKM